VRSSNRSVHETHTSESLIRIAPGGLDALADLIGDTVRAHRAVIISDSTVGPLYADRAAAALRAMDPAVLTVAPGERHKTRESWAALTDQMLQHGVGRDGLVVALGGGVVGDLAGFVAATYMRGIALVQVPTSLVAMIDASIGGKTAVDVPAGKNLVGAFHPAAVVIVDPELLATLPKAEFRAGLAEAIKHGAIADAGYFDWIEANGAQLMPGASVGASAGASAGAPDGTAAGALDGATFGPSRSAGLLDELVVRSVEIKARVVVDDPFERGARKILNFGHTLGHALEAASAYSLRHGEAIAIGMTLEAGVGEHVGVTARGTASRIARVLESVGLPAETDLDHNELVMRTHTDKKVRGGGVEYALPRTIGQFESWTTPVSDASVLEALSLMSGDR
jgi:3-dehydroquinate synthase